MSLKKTIVYMGTPDFAVPPLEALHQADFDIQLVITQPDRPKGRGRRLTSPAVKLAAQAMGNTVYQPPGIRSADTIARLQDLAPDFIVVVAYGQILPMSILQIPKYGAINLHASLLPKYRGPAPIQWALMRCEAETGVTSMLMDQGVDTGDILLSRSCPISTEDTTDTLSENLAGLGAELLIETLHLRHQGRIYPQSQNHAQATFAPLLKKQNGRIDWHNPAPQLDAFIRAMASWPGAFCFWQDTRLKIFKARSEPGGADLDPGTIVPGFPDELRIATGDGILSVLELQGASGKKMAIHDFLRGHAIAPGMKLT